MGQHHSAPVIRTPNTEVESDGANIKTPDNQRINAICMHITFKVFSNAYMKTVMMALVIIGPSQLDCVNRLLSLKEIVI